jgi:hypothetical protein
MDIGKAVGPETISLNFTKLQRFWPFLWKKCESNNQLETNCLNGYKYIEFAFFENFKNGDCIELVKELSRVMSV